MPRQSRKRQRSRSSSPNNERVIKILKRLEKQMDKMERKQREYSESNSDSDSSASEQINCESDGDETMGGSSAGDIETGNPNVENTPQNTQLNGASSPPRSTLNRDILSVLGNDINVISQTVRPIQQDVADRWIHIIKNGLENENRKTLVMKYPSPENGRVFGAPKLNPIVKQAITDSVSKRDDRFANIQQQIGASLSAIGIVISELLKKEEGANKEMIESLSDAGRLLSGIHHTESVCRKDLASLNLNKELKETLSESPTDEWLFGENLDERLKTAKSLQLSSKQLQATKPVRKPNTTRSNLNWKGPLKSRRGAKQSERYRQAPSNSSYNRPAQYPRQEKLKGERKYRRQ